MIIRGIDFPNEIVRSIRNNNLVVFVGAGVSMGKPTCLPNFEDLAKQIAKGSGIEKKENEPCDVFLGKLKFNNIDVNSIAGERLSGLHLKPNELHKYIVSLFNDEQSLKIITTNYDQMLEEAAKDLYENIYVYSSPALPLGNDISGIVHIHGNINEPQYMVLTDSDFGHAYMIDGYVSRFLVELFESYTILFIGYSYNDIIMRYLTRAMVKDGECRRYILTDNNSEGWKQLGIEPIIFKQKDFDSLYEGVKYLGKITNRKPSEWKLLLENVSKNPPTDYDLKSEVEYCLEDSNKSKLFTEIVHGEGWLWWLDKRHVFDNIFSCSTNISENDKLWINWITKEFVVESKEIIQKLILEHNEYSDEFACNVLKYAINNQNQMTDEQLSSLFGIFKDRIDDEWILSKFIEIFVTRGKFFFAWDLFKKFYKCRIVITPPWSISNGNAVDYQNNFIGKGVRVKTAWQKISVAFLPLYPKTILEFGRNKILEIHDRYCMFGLADERNEPMWMNVLPIEEINRKSYSNDIIIMLIDYMQKAVSELQKNKSSYLQEYIYDCLTSRSVLLKKVALKILRTTSSFSIGKKAELLLKNFDLYSETYKEQIFWLVHSIFDELTEQKRNEIVDIIDNGRNSEDEKIDTYEKYNWCIWLMRCNKKNDRLEKIVKNIKKKYPNFQPRKNPQLKIEYLDPCKWGKESPYTEDELLRMNIDSLIKVLSEYQGDYFDGPNRDGLLLIFRKCVGCNYNWIFNIIPKLKHAINVKSDIWPCIYESIIYSEIKTKEKYKLLKLLSDEEYINTHFDLISKLMKIIIEDSEKEEIREFEDKIWDISCYILNNKLTDNYDYYRNDIIDISRNCSSSLCVMSLIRLYALCNEAEGERYILLFSKILMEEREDKRQIVCVLAGQFNFFFNRNKKWCLEYIFPYLSSENDDEFSDAWEGYISYSGRVCYEDDKAIQGMYLNAIYRLNLFKEDSRRQFIELYSTLIVKGIKDPLNNYIVKLLEYGSDEDYCTFANTVKEMLESMTEKKVDSIWNDWLKEYVYNRTKNSPITFKKDELICVAEWIFNLLSHKAEFLRMITNVEISANDCSILLSEINEREWYKENPNETITILLWILNADDISNYIFEEIKYIIYMLEKYCVDCSSIREKLIDKGKVI